MNTYRDAAQQADQRRDHLLCEAERERLAQAAQAGQQPTTDRILAVVGEWMIASGKRLKERSAYRVPSAERNQYLTTERA